MGKDIHPKLYETKNLRRRKSFVVPRRSALLVQPIRLACACLIRVFQSFESPVAQNENCCLPYRFSKDVGFLTGLAFKDRFRHGGASSRRPSRAAAFLEFREQEALISMR